MGGRCRHPRRLEPGRRRADDDNLVPLARRRRDMVRHRRLAPGRRVVDAERLAAEIDAIDAIARADAGADVLLASLCELARDMWIGDMGARHPDYVELAAGNGVTRRPDVLATARVEHRNPRAAAH